MLSFPRAFAAEAKTAHWAFFSDLHIKTEDDHDKIPKGHGYYNPHAHITQCVKETLAAQPEGLIDPAVRVGNCRRGQ